MRKEDVAANPESATEGGIAEGNQAVATITAQPEATGDEPARVDSEIRPASSGLENGVALERVNNSEVEEIIGPVTSEGPSAPQMPSK